MLKILHVSDTQWPDGLEEKTIVACAQAEKVDFIVHTGDLLDRKKKPTNSEAREIIALKLRILVRESGLPVIIIPGNHDPDSFRHKTALEKAQALTEVISLFRQAGAIVPDGAPLSLNGKISLTYLNRFSTEDFFYGVAVSGPINAPAAGAINIAIAHGVGYVPYQSVMRQELTWDEAVILERRNTQKTWRDILSAGYDIILCGHHRHTNVKNGLYRAQNKIISLRGQHQSGDEQLDRVARRGTLLTINEHDIQVDTIELTTQREIRQEEWLELPDEN